MNVKIQELEKQLHELKATCTSSFAKIEVLEAKMNEANDKINYLSLSRSKVSEDAAGSSCDNETEKNQMMVQKLSCDEVSGN